MFSKSKHIILLLFFLVTSTFTRAQNGFEFVNPKHSKAKVNFKLNSNLIILPVELNGVKLSFILDTGATNTLLFNVTNIDSLEIKNTRLININGLGSSKPIEAIHSEKNTLKIGNVINRNQDLLLLVDREINFSARLGVPIHGIIGSNLIKNFVFEINYSKEKMTFRKKEDYKPKNKKYLTYDLIKRNNRYHIKADVNINDSIIPVNLLVDTGASDALWLFKDKKKGIHLPEKNFRDFIGRGIAGDIFGSRSRLKKIKLGKFELKNTKVAFPDSTNIALAFAQKDREGSLGSELLKRFNVVVNPYSQKLYLKKNRLYKKPFEYNMSGIQIQHDGMRLIQVLDPSLFFQKKNEDGVDSNKVFSITGIYKTELIPVYRIINVRENSPAYEAGIKKDDILLSVNDNNLYDEKIGEILEMLSKKEGKKMRVTVDRKGKTLRFDFKLKRLL